MPSCRGFSKLMHTEGCLAGNLSGNSLAASSCMACMEGLNFRSLRVNPLFGNFRGIYFRCMHYHLLVTE